MMKLSLLALRMFLDSLFKLETIIEMPHPLRSMMLAAMVLFWLYARAKPQSLSIKVLFAVTESLVENSSMPLLFQERLIPLTVTASD